MIFLARYSNTQVSKSTKGFIFYDKQHKVKLLTKTITSAEQGKPCNYKSFLLSFQYCHTVHLYKDLICSGKRQLCKVRCCQNEAK